jgi:hypothetical protein
MPPPRERASPRRTPSRWRTRRPRLAIALVFSALAALSPRASAAVDDADVDDPTTRAPRGSIAVELSTNDAVASRRDTYTYTHASMPRDGAHYITRFEPKADMAIVHHMLLFGCERGVASTLRTRSGGMFSAPGAATSVEPRGAMCADSNVEPFIFGWGKNAPDLVLPKDVGFRVGAEGGGFESLVLEVHYLEAQVRSVEGYKHVFHPPLGFNIDLIAWVPFN